MPERRDPRLFDANKPLVMARTAEMYHHTLAPGDAIRLLPPDSEIDEDTPAGHIPEEVGLRLWLSGVLNYKPDTSAHFEHPYPDGAEVQVSGGDGGWYQITAPWLVDPEKVQGRDNALARREEIEQTGDTKGVTIVPANGSWSVVTAPWIEKPFKLNGTAAQRKYDELVKEGPPEGWVYKSPEQLKAEKEAEEAELARQNTLAEARRLAEEEAERGRQADAAAIEAAKQREAEQAAKAEIQQPAADGSEAAQTGDGEPTPPADE